MFNYGVGNFWGHSVESSWVVSAGCVRRGIGHTLGSPTWTFFPFCVHYKNLAPPSSCDTFPPLRYQHRQRRVVWNCALTGRLTCNSNMVKSGQNKRYREEKEHRKVPSKVAKDTHLARLIEWVHDLDKQRDRSELTPGPAMAIKLTITPPFPSSSARKIRRSSQSTKAGFAQHLNSSKPPARSAVADHRGPSNYLRYLSATLIYIFTGSTPLRSEGKGKGKGKGKKGKERKNKHTTGSLTFAPRMSRYSEEACAKSGTAMATWFKRPNPTTPN